jgi:glycosyltransferase involved in cell wall biosynthesis
MLNASRIDNFPGALIEASGSGLIVISTRAGGIPSIYQHERNALLVEIGDWQQMADSVRRVIGSPTMAPELIRAGLATVRACDWNSVRQALYRAYGLAPDASGDPCGLTARLPHSSFKLAGED